VIVDDARRIVEHRPDQADRYLHRGQQHLIAIACAREPALVLESDDGPADGAFERHAARGIEREQPDLSERAVKTPRCS